MKNFIRLLGLVTIFFSTLAIATPGSHIAGGTLGYGTQSFK